VIARLIHDLSPRAAGPWFSLNCAALPGTLAESELFGHEKGAFTGAERRKRGLLELADGGTLFLDEINSASPAVQARLLQFVQEHRLMRIGGESPLQLDVRLVAASNQPLERLAAEGDFRQDLYFRLKVFPIALPPLRERTEDVLPLAEHFIARYAREFNLPPSPLDPDAARTLTRYPWPGNVRELENVIQRALVLSGGAPITADLLPGEAAPGQIPGAGGLALPEGATLAEVERLWIDHTLALCGGNKREAARRLDIDPSTLHRRLRRR